MTCDTTAVAGNYCSCRHGWVLSLVISTQLHIQHPVHCDHQGMFSGRLCKSECNDNTTRTRKFSTVLMLTVFLRRRTQVVLMFCTHCIGPLIESMILPVKCHVFPVSDTIDYCLFSVVICVVRSVIIIFTNNNYKIVSLSWWWCRVQVQVTFRSGGPVSDKLIRTIHCYRIVGSLGFLQPETLPSKNKSVVKFRKELHDEWLLYFVCSEFAAEQSVYFNSK